MRNYIVLIFCGLLLLSCAPHNMRVSNLTSYHKVREPADEVDHNCSYFYFLWARSAELDGHDDEAQAAYEKAIVCDPDSDYLVRRLSALLLRMGKTKQAVSWMAKLIAAQPHNVGLRIFLADLYASMGDLGKAEKIYLQALGHAPANSDIMLKLGKVYLRQKDYLQARNILERMVRMVPDSFAGYYYLARLYRQTHYFDKARAAYKRVLEINWLPPLALEAAAFYEQSDHKAAAVALYRKILRRANGVNNEALGRLVGIYIGEKKFKEALDILKEERDLAADPDNIDFTMGRVYLRAEDYPAAIKLFKAMLKRDKNFDNARFLLALAYYENGDTKAAKKLLLTVGIDADSYSESVFMLVKIYADEKDYKAAINLLKGVIDRKQDQENFYFTLAVLYEEAGQTAKAVETFKEAVRLFPDSAAARRKYALFLDRCGHGDAALRQMLSSLSLEADNVMALNYVGYTWADRGVHLHKALDYIKKALAARPDDGYIRDSLGWVYFKLGENEKARLELKKALTEQGDDPTIHEHLGDVLRAMGLNNEALENYYKSLKAARTLKDKERLRTKIKKLERP